MGATIGILQLMHPAVGAGVMEHSNFFDDPMDRVARSLPAILGAVYDGPEADATGRWVRDQHTDIKGVDAAGRSEEHTSELQSLMRISYDVFCLKNNNNK